MIGALLSRWVTASIATFLYWLAASMLMAFIPIRMSELGHSDLEIGVAVAGRAFLPFLLATSLGRLADRVGTRRLVAPSALVMAATCALQGAATEPWEFTVLQATFGLATIGVWLALQSVITHAGTGEVLRNNLALFSLGWGAGAALGPAAGALVYESFGFAALCWASAAGTLLILAVAAGIPWSVERDARAAAPSGGRLRVAMGALAGRPAIRAVLLSSFVSHYLNSIRQSFYPVVLERNGFSVGQIGLLLSIVGFSSLAVRVLMPALTRAFGSGQILTWSTIGAVLAISVTPVFATLWPLVVAAIVLGIQMGLNPPITIELMARYSTASERGLAAGMRTTVNRLAQTTQPLLFGGMASAIGVVAAFPVSSVLLCVMAAGVARSVRSVARDDGDGEGP